MKPLRLIIVILLIPMFLSSCGSHKKVITNTEVSKRAELSEYTPRKYEMRAVWFPTVYRTEYVALNHQEIKQSIIQKLNLLKKTGFNVVIFQVRSEADAWYQSAYEPWSRYLTGEQGRAPIPLWDPLQFLVQECHARNMELHVWINPYRAAVNKGSQIAMGHPYFRYPEWFITYGNQLLFNPALPQVRDYLAFIVEDLVTRYDIDAIHMDDYFYPYPIRGEEFPDRNDYTNDPRGFQRIEDWRRDNVNLLIMKLHQVIKKIKPHVRFGISPFGIYRNMKNDPNGSRTNGLQNYDDLYADVLYWDQQGWIDYLIPQIYWEIGNRAAEYTELALWWKRNIRQAQYFIGQDIRRTMDRNELHAKMNITSQVAEGQCFWPGDDIFTNYANITSQLQSKYWIKPALIPPTPYPSMQLKRDEPHRQAFTTKVTGEHELVWEPDGTYPQGLDTKHYVIYCHPRGTKLARATSLEYLMDMTTDHRIKLPDLGGKNKVAFTITRINRYNHEIIVAHNIKGKL